MPAASHYSISGTHFKRFDTLPAQLTAVLAHLALHLAKSEVYALAQTALLQLYKGANSAHKPSLPVDIFSQLDSSVKACIICHIMQQVPDKTMILGSNFALTEEANVHDKRMRLSEMLSSMQAAIEEISQYKHAFHISTYS